MHAPIPFLLMKIFIIRSKQLATEYIHIPDMHALCQYNVPSSTYDFLERVEWGTLQCNILLWMKVQLYSRYM